MEDTREKTRLRLPDKLDNRHPSSDKSDRGLVPWSLRGELILNCNCTVFCPCVVSLGKHPPTEGVCQAWAGIRIDEGKYGEEPLSGLNVGMILEIPGMMARGNWKAAAYIDRRASHKAYHGLIQILSGKAKGTTGLFKMLVSEFLGAERADVAFETEGSTRRLKVAGGSTAKLCRLTARGRVRTLLFRTPSTGWVRTLRSRRQRKVGSGPSVGFGISAVGPPKSARLIGRVPQSEGSGDFADDQASSDAVLGRR